MLLTATLPLDVFQQDVVSAVGVEDLALVVCNTAWPPATDTMSPSFTDTRGILIWEEISFKSIANLDAQRTK